MFTAEELEECDIFPKKITAQIIIKIIIYGLFMGTAATLLYSFYSGRDFTSLITLDGIKYGSDSYFLNRMYKFDSRFNYNISDRYSLHLNDLEKDPLLLIKDYVSKSLPLIIKNMTTMQIFEKFYTNKIYIDNDKEIIVEKRSDPNIVYFSNGFSSLKMKYSNFLKEAQNNRTMINYVINEISLDETIYEFVKYYKNDNSFLKPLNLKNVKLTEGFDEIINPGHMEYTENIYCMIEGDIDLMIISPLQRNFVYPYKRDYGPPNYSAVNFFKAEYGRFPNFRETHRLYITLSKGDCLLIPSYWWFSYRTKNNEHFVNLKLEFESHSRWVSAIFQGLQNEDI